MVTAPSLRISGLAHGAVVLVLAMAGCTPMMSPMTPPDGQTTTTLRFDGRGAEEFDYNNAELQGLGEHCSSTERKADEATRDALDWLKCEYMQDKVGETFNGIITSVNSFGVFVELEEIYIDGLVHITALDNDYYHYDPIGHRLTGERTGKVLRLGDPLAIVVANVNLDDRKIDFVPADAGERKRSRKEGKKRADRSQKAGETSTDSAKKRPRRRRSKAT